MNSCPVSLHCPYQPEECPFCGEVAGIELINEDEMEILYDSDVEKGFKKQVMGD